MEFSIIVNTELQYFTSWLKHHTRDGAMLSLPTDGGHVNLRTARPSSIPNVWEMVGTYTPQDGLSHQMSMIEFKCLLL